VAPNIEFVLMRGDGSLRIGGLSQIRSHTTKEQHKKRRRNAEVRLQSLHARADLRD
jgi:hypothetical protein